ncbi:polyprenyl synthetase family protein [Bacillus spongiae]|uniref:Polyprenyl synthetase family protein n=1 Tax=Bacillus spongiae TaxID=2683610 RepID=A0ABU8HG32_9BACI
MNVQKRVVEDELESTIHILDAPKSLKEAMLYSLRAGGKRIRPLLMLATMEAFQQDVQKGYPVACAVEMIHTYSLIHDDLPSMDDDDLRRGMPTNHKVFGEALAILAGDGLLTYSFQVLSEMNGVSASDKIRLIRYLAQSAGPEGMVGGQVADIEGEDTSLSLEDLMSIHENKTGRLLTFSVVSAAILCGASEQVIDELEEFSKHIGLAFQIQDDILDIEGSEEKIGKPVGSDEINQKSTYPSLLGLEEAKAKLAEHSRLAKEILAKTGLHTHLLMEIVDLIVKRDH